MLSVAFLLLVFMVVQAALYYHARNVVKAEAEAVARKVRAYPSESGSDAVDRIPTQSEAQLIADGEARRQWEVLDNSGDTTSRPAVRTIVTVGTNQVQITITARPIMILPGLFGGDGLQIEATAGGPFEVFKRSGED